MHGLGEMTLTQTEQLFIAQALLSRARRKAKDLQRIVAKYPETPLTGALRHDICECTRLAILMQQQAAA